MDEKDTNIKNRKYFFVLFILIAILFIYNLINFLELNKINNLNVNDLYNILISNCTEKYQEVNIEYEEIIQGYIDEIFTERNDTEMLMLYLNLENMYTDKIDISLEDMKNKLNEIKANGTRLKSYEHKFIADKDVFICKIGAKNTPFTVYEYMPNVYSFAFDGFVE